MRFRPRFQVFHNSRRGAALLIALFLVLCLVAMVAASQKMVTTQLAASKTERDYERALLMAEAGVNSYFNFLTNGAGTGASASLVPTDFDWNGAGSAPSLEQCREWIASGTSPYYDHFVPYPNKAANQGFLVGRIGTAGGLVRVVSVGWSNGVVRRVQVNGASFNLFDWAALWGINPSGAWSLTGDLTVVGAFGGEGVMSWGNNSKFYDGPAIKAGPNASWASGTPTATGASSPGVPTGHIGNGPYYPGVASPFVRSMSKGLVFNSADSTAMEDVGGTTGVEYVRTHNNNLTGLRYLVWQNGQPSTITELTVGYTSAAGFTDSGGNPVTGYTVTGYVVGNGNKKTYNVPAGTSGIQDTYVLLSSGSHAEFAAPADLNTWIANQGLGSGYSFYGIRIYPGNYFFEQLAMGSNDILNVRSYNDSDRSSLPSPSTANASQYLTYRPVNDLANPNSGKASERNTRVFVGHVGGTLSGTSDAASSFTNGNNMEYYEFPSRYRVYIASLTASNKAVTVTGTSASNLPPAFNVNMLVYNKTSASNTANIPAVNGNAGYGYIKFTSGSPYLRGSLIAWNVSGSGSPIVEKVATEGGATYTGDRLTYYITDWTEL